MSGAPDELPVFELQLIQTVIDAALGQQFLVRPRLTDLALVEHEDAIHVLNGRETVCDRNRRTSTHDDLQRVADQQLGFGIHA